MGGITSGVGLFSGIDSRQLIDQLLALEARPKQLAQQRIVGLQAQRAAFLDINTALLSLKTTAAKFATFKSFRAAQADSSNSDVLTATAGADAAAGSYQLSVKRLVSTQQHLTRGFADKDSAAVGLTSLSFETGGGSLVTETLLSELNGAAGVERGKIQIKDASGATATVDLSTAATVGEVLDAINSTTGVRVTASIDGDRIALKDTSGVSGTLLVSNAFGSNTASSLGIAKTSAAGVGQSITGDRVRTLGGATALSTLNDGNGVLIRTGSSTADFTITARNGFAFDIILGEITETTTDPDTQVETTTVVQTRATTLQEAINYINAQTEGAVTAALDASKTGLVLTDNTGGGSNLIVRNGLTGRTTATDLGLETDSAGVASSTLSGKRLIAGLNSTLTRNLKGGDGLAAGALTITDRAGNATTLNLTDADLAGSVSDLVKTINTQLTSAGVGASFSVNSTANGIALTDTSGGTGNLQASGALATALGVASTGASGGEIKGANLQTRWFNRALTLASLNGGKGIGTGTIRVTTADGNSKTISIGESVKTVDEFIQFVDGFGGQKFEVSVNDTGDGLLFKDTSGGGGAFKIEDVTGAVAKNLGIATTAAAGGTLEIDGSFERTVAVLATDSLQKVADKINAAGVGVAASIIRDGSGSTPFRLSLTARQSGAVGRTIVDTGATDLALSTLAKGEDAIAFFGAADPAKAVLLSSSTNALSSVIQGVTVNLKTASSEPVELVVSRDTEAIEKDVKAFVDAFNNALDRINRHDRYDPDTNTRGALFGDGTVSALKTELFRLVQGTPEGVDGQFQRLFQVGVRIGSGSRLELDSQDFQAAIDQGILDVEQLFAAKTLESKNTTIDLGNGITVNNPDAKDSFSALGVAEQLARLADSFTSSVDGTLTRRDQTIDTQIKLQNDRIAGFDRRLDAKRARLERQFVAMEQAIASLQQQSGQLASIRAVG